jgi:7TMR-DISM extracellular 2
MYKREYFNLLPLRPIKVKGFSTKFKNYFFLFFIFYFTSPAIGQEFTITKGIRLPYNLSSEVSLFEDTTAKLSFEQIKHKPFQKNSAKRVLLPFSNHITWLKVKLNNHSGVNSNLLFLFDNPLIRKITLYADNQSNSLVFEPFKIHELSKSKNPNFKTHLRQGEIKEFYFKLESQRGIYFLLQLYDINSFEQLKDSNKIGFGFMSGLTWMVIFIVFAVGFLIIKDNKSKAYAIYTFFRAIGFWSTMNVFGTSISTNPFVSEKLAFIFGSIYPIISAFLALSILPTDKLPRWVKNAMYGFITANLLLLAYLLLNYGPLPLK